MMSSLPFAISLIISYALIGAGIKILDYTTDDPTQFHSSKIYLWLITFGLVILVNIWIFLDIFTAILAMGIILGLVATRKVDNDYFFVLVITILPLSIFRILNVFFFILPTLIVVFVVSLLDELLHSEASKLQSPTFRQVLMHRPLLKIAVFLLPFLGSFTFIHTFAFWTFDITYDLVAYYFGASRTANTYSPFNEAPQTGPPAYFGKV